MVYITPEEKAAQKYREALLRKVMLPTRIEEIKKDNTLDIVDLVLVLSILMGVLLVIVSV
jgi:hypothetical protein|tara:strand:+ start:167 stop:346 length:180 start_codon:yes stop_codon:yes gene_type:complete